MMATPSDLPNFNFPGITTLEHFYKFAKSARVFVFPGRSNNSSAIQSGCRALVPSPTVNRY